MASAEPIIVVLGPWCGGTSAVAGVLHHLGVLMGTEFRLDLSRTARHLGGLESKPIVPQGLHRTWRSAANGCSLFCRRNFALGPTVIAVPPASRGNGLASSTRFSALRWISCVTPGVRWCRLWWTDHLEKVVASLNRLGWWKDEHERAEATAHLIAARDPALVGTATVRVDFEALRATPADVIRRLADELHLNVTDAQVEAAVESIVQSADLRDADPYGRSICYGPR